jgi:hypothetical protein
MFPTTLVAQRHRLAVLIVSQAQVCVPMKDRSMCGLLRGAVG